MHYNPYPSNQIPSANYNGYDPKNLSNNGESFQKSFTPLPTINYNGYDPKSLFNNNNFNNNGNILHNNLKSILLNEEIREYSVMIDSKDRNYQIYPDPFSYEVRFNPIFKSRNRVNGRIVTYEDPAPTINDNFINVRYIKLDSVILPFYTKTRYIYDKNDTDTLIKSHIVDTKRSLTDNLYIVLSIGDYNDNNYRSTNDVLSDSFAVIYYDGKVSNTHYKGITSNGIKIFQQDQLAKIDKLKINFTDPYGRLLMCNHLDKNIQSNLECICEDPDGDNDTHCFIHNLSHPLNPIFQHHLQFKIGVVEPRLHKKTFN